MIEPDELENQADQEHDRANVHAESEELLRRQADEQREAQAREEETHDN